VIGAEIRVKFAEEAESRQKAGKKQDETLGQNCPKVEGRSAELASEAIGGAASANSIKKASKVLEQGSAALVEAVKSGDVKVSDAEKIVDLPKGDQNEALKAVQTGEARTLSEAVRAAGGIEEKELLDKLKGVVPKNLRAVFESAKVLAQIAKEISTKAGEFQEQVAGTKEECPAGQYFLRTHQDIVKRLKECAANIRSGIPYAVCPYCKGKGNDCKRCSGSCGYVNEATYRGFPETAKK